jgi:hypothetical protein
MTAPKVRTNAEIAAPFWNNDKRIHKVNRFIAYSDADERQHRKRQEEFKETDFGLHLRLWILGSGLCVLFIAPLIAGTIEFIRYDWPKRTKRVP